MIPAIDSASAPHDAEIENNGFQRYSLVTSFEVTDTANDPPQINGRPYSDYVNTSAVYGQTPLGSIVMNKGVINFYNGGSVVACYPTSETATTYTPCGKVTLSGGTLKLYNMQGTETASISGISYAYLPDKTGGNYIAANTSTTPVYFDKTATLVQWTSVSTNSWGVLRGPYSHMMLGIWSVNSTINTSPTTSLTATIAEGMGNPNLYTIATSNPIYVIVPYKYTAQETNEYAALFGVIPTIVFIALMVAAVGVFFARGRND